MFILLVSHLLFPAALALTENCRNKYVPSWDCCYGEITLDPTMTTIESDAFYGCSGLTGSLTIPDSVITVKSKAFYGCSGFTGSLTISDSVTTIESNAFYGCSGFTGSLTIPDSVTTIAIYAFYNCSGFTGSLTISDSVTTIESNAFYGCSGFTGSLTIPDSVTTIESYAFYGCSGFTGSLTIPDSVKKIEDVAFYGCSGFTGSLTIPDSVTYIGDYAFSYCSGFTSAITYPVSFNHIGNGAFYGSRCNWISCCDKCTSKCECDDQCEGSGPVCLVDQCYNSSEDCNSCPKYFSNFDCGSRSCLSFHLSYELPAFFIGEGLFMILLFVAMIPKITVLQKLQLYFLFIIPTLDIISDIFYLLTQHFIRLWVFPTCFGLIIFPSCYFIYELFAVEAYPSLYHSFCIKKIRSTLLWLSVVDHNPAVYGKKVTINSQNLIYRYFVYILIWSFLSILQFICYLPLLIINLFLVILYSPVIVLGIILYQTKLMSINFVWNQWIYSLCTREDAERLFREDSPDIINILTFNRALIIHLCFESVPQIVLKLSNAGFLNKITEIAVISLFFSGLMVLFVFSWKIIKKRSLDAVTVNPEEGPLPTIIIEDGKQNESESYLRIEQNIEIEDPPDCFSLINPDIEMQNRNQPVDQKLLDELNSCRETIELLKSEKRQIEATNLDQKKQNESLLQIVIQKQVEKEVLLSESSTKMNKLQEANQSLENTLIQKESELQRFQKKLFENEETLKNYELALARIERKRGVGLKEPHVRVESFNINPHNANTIGSNIGEPGLAIVDGTYRRLGQDIPCKLKMATNPLQLSRLEHEKRILEAIRRNDTHGQQSQFIVTLLNSEEFLSNESENLYFFNEDGEISPPSSLFSSPMKSLVFESGGMNLKQFMSKNRLSIHVIQRLQILGEIVRALDFLHDLHIVHFDLKPENIVSFSSSSGSTVRWKLIDFDSSYDVSNSNSNPIMIRYPSNDANIRVTEEYTSPEIMRILNYNGNPNNQAIPVPVPVDVEVSWRIDIWSLGVIGVFLFSNYSLWDLMYPTKPFKNTMVSTVTQERIQLSFANSPSIGTKEKSFLDSCLQVDKGKRMGASGLLQKSLFKTDLPTAHSSNLQKSNETLIVELQRMMSQIQEESLLSMSEDLETKLRDVHSCLSHEMEKIRNEDL